MADGRNHLREWRPQVKRLKENAGNERLLDVYTYEDPWVRRELKIYWDKIRATFAGHQVKVLINYGRLEGLEGDLVEGYRDRGIPELRSGQGMVRTIISL